MNDPRPATARTPGIAGMVSWARHLPGLAQLFHYPAGALRHDLQAGLVLTAVLVPVGIAYAVASGVPALCGLYATVFGLLAYAVFGPSRVLVLGPDSSLVAIILGVVLPLSGGDPQRAIALAGAVALVSGGLCLLAGVARLGFVTELLSKPIRYGYMNGIALMVLFSQLPALLGLPTGGLPAGADGLLAQGLSVLHGLRAGKANTSAMALGLGSLGLILLLRRWPGVPAVLLAVVAATLLTAWAGLDGPGGVPALGALPQGLPGLHWPWLQASDLGPVLLAGLAAALVSLADTSMLARSYAAKDDQVAQPNQEMVALGVANLVAGLFQGIPISASATRTPVALSAGARTPLAALVGALAVAGLLSWAPALLQHLPHAALAAVVMAAALVLFEVRDLRRIHRIQPWEFWLSIGCTAGVVVLGAVPGIGLAIVVAVIEFLWDGWRPHSAVLGRVSGLPGYHDISRHPQARREAGLVLFRWDAPLFFANAEWFKTQVLAAVVASPTPVRWVVVGAEPVTSVDVTAADAVGELDSMLQAAGIRLCFAEMKDPVKDKLKRFGLLALLGEQRFFATVGEAVRQYRALQALAAGSPGAPLPSQTTDQVPQKV